MTLAILKHGLVMKMPPYLTTPPLGERWGARSSVVVVTLPCFKSARSVVKNSRVAEWCDVYIHSLVVVLFPIPLEQENLHQVHLTFPRNSLTHQVWLFIQPSQGNAPAVQKMSRRSKERAGTGKERLYPLHKSHTTQMTASKARQGRLMSPGTPALYR
ncbi:hypothetical protein TNCV_3368281 [Trichonephila clavipes]|nr:hypothetical protein TNCV_3368281 [Trichonephila clavipes]